jgi:nitrogen fixation/metabolism regulation signal transduction histidine kinase
LLLFPSSRLWLWALLPVLILLPGVLLILGPLKTRLNRMQQALDCLVDRDFSCRLTAPAQEGDRIWVGQFNGLLEALQEERRQQYQRELLLQAVVQQHPAALILVDCHDRMVLANRQACAMLQLEAHYFGQSWSELCAHCPPAFSELVRLGRSDSFSLGEQAQFHYGFVDLTLKNSPHRLHVLRETGEEWLRHELQAWKKVIRVISHELNNSLGPATSMLQSAHYLLEQGQLGEAQALLPRVAERLRELHRFLDAHASLAKLPAAKPQPVDLHALLSELAAIWKFSFVPGEPSQVRLDPVLLQQALINLFRNAMEAGASELELWAQAAKPGWALYVRDNGPGMAAELLRSGPQLFRTSKPNGSGLGLVLCQEIMHRHGGRLELANHRDGGLLVTLHFPATTDFFAKQ